MYSLAAPRRKPCPLLFATARGRPGDIGDIWELRAHPNMICGSDGAGNGDGSDTGVSMAAAVTAEACAVAADWFGRLEDWMSQR
jgi:hypothetical protein